jgi:hypothetical protein
MRRDLRSAALVVSVFLFGFVPLHTSPARALRSAHIAVQTADPTAGTLAQTNVQVLLGADDYQDPQPTGNAVVTDNGVTIGTAIPGGCHGYACLTFKYTFEAGDHSLVAAYPGDSQFAAVSSSPLTFTLDKLRAMTALTNDATPTSDGQPPTVVVGHAVTFTAKVQPYQTYKTARQPTGTVTFQDETDSNRLLGTQELHNNAASLTTTLPIGPATGNYHGIHTVIVHYSGDANFTEYAPNDIINQVRVVEASSSSGGTAPTSAGGSGPTRTTTATGSGGSGTSAGGTSQTGGANPSTTEGGGDQGPTIGLSDDHAIGVTSDARRKAASRSSGAGDASSAPVMPLVAGLAALAAAGAVAARHVRARKISQTS